MNFLRQNLFLVITALLLVVVSAVLVMVTRTATGRIDRAIAQRTEVNRSMLSLMSGQRVNSQVFEARKARVDVMRRLHEQVAEAVLARNVRNYSVLEFADPDGPGGKPIPAFPLDSKVYSAKALRLQFAGRCRQELKKLLDTVQPTSPPTPDEIKEEVERVTGRSSGARTAAPVGPSMLAPTGPSRESMYYRQQYYRPDYSRSTYGRPVRTGEPEQARQATPEEEVETNLKLEKARAGWIYADEDALYTPLITTGQYYDDDVLWEAQIALWVQRDVLAAINRTNAEVQRGSKHEKGVPSSAVKQLVRVTVPGYVVERGAPASTGTESKSRESAFPVSRDKLTYLQVGGPGGATPPQLTQRGCDQVADVVHYTFTVVISSTELLRLYRNLMLENYHTILDVTLNEPGKTQPGRGVSTEYRRASPAEMYYYGTQHMVEATITGELQLLTSWTRGRWDEKAKEWDRNRPPLMPARFLQRIAFSNPGALRTEDNERLKKAGLGATATDGGRQTPVGGQYYQGHDYRPQGRYPSPSRSR